MKLIRISGSAPVEQFPVVVREPRKHLQIGPWVPKDENRWVSWYLL